MERNAVIVFFWNSRKEFAVHHHTNDARPHQLVNQLYDDLKYSGGTHGFTKKTVTKWQTTQTELDQLEYYYQYLVDMENGVVNLFSLEELNDQLDLVNPDIHYKHFKEKRVRQYQQQICDSIEDSPGTERLRERLRDFVKDEARLIDLIVDDQYYQLLDKQEEPFKALPDLPERFYGWSQVTVKEVTTYETVPCQTSVWSTSSPNSGHNFIKVVLNYRYEAGDRLVELLVEELKPENKPPIVFFAGMEMWRRLTPEQKEVWNQWAKKAPKSKEERSEWLNSDETQPLYDHLHECAVYVLGRDKVVFKLLGKTFEPPKVLEQEETKETKVPKFQSPNVRDLRLLSKEYLQDLLLDDDSPTLRLIVNLRTKITQSPEMLKLWDGNDPKGSIEAMKEQGLF